MDNFSTGYCSNIPAGSIVIEDFCQDWRLLEAMGQMPFGMEDTNRNGIFLQNYKKLFQSFQRITSCLP